MADKGNTSSYIERLKVEIKKNQKKISDLEEEKKQLQEQLRDHEENCQAKSNEINEEIAELKEEIAGLREEIAGLREDNQILKMEIGDFGESNVFLDNKMESMKKELESTKKKLKEHDEKLKTLDLSEDELIIIQLCSCVQQNMLNIVLQEFYDKIENKSIKYMEKYISTQIEDEDKQDEARGRWEKLKEEIEWDDYLIIQLQSVKQRGNETAHPPLTEERIEKAKMNLREKKMLGKNNVKAVDKLKNIWQQTNSKLQWNGPITRSAEDRRSRKRPAEDRPETRSTEGRD